MHFYKEKEQKETQHIHHGFILRVQRHVCNTRLWLGTDVLRAKCQDAYKPLKRTYSGRFHVISVCSVSPVTCLHSLMFKKLFSVLILPELQHLCSPSVWNHYMTCYMFNAFIQSDLHTQYCEGNPHRGNVGWSVLPRDTTTWGPSQVDYFHFLGPRSSVSPEVDLSAPSWVASHGSYFCRRTEDRGARSEER